MIDIVNQDQLFFDPNLGVNVQGLSVDQRKAIFQRALHATPFFNIFNFPDFDVTSTIHSQAYGTKLGVDKDFYITEILSNHNEVFGDSGQIGINIYSAYTGKSVYGFNRSNPLPPSLVGVNVGGPYPVQLEKFCDIQRETIPYLINRGDNLIANLNIVKSSSSQAAISPSIVLAGYNINSYPYLDSVGMQKINDSLNIDPEYQIFAANIDEFTCPPYSKQEFKQITNDNKPRLILGCAMAYMNAEDNIADTNVRPRITIEIQDISRQVKWQNSPLPLHYIAPMIPSLAIGGEGAPQPSVDTHLYWLPIEYYFQPFGDLQLRVTMDNSSAPDSMSGWQLQLLTRTV